MKAYRYWYECISLAAVLAAAAAAFHARPGETPLPPAAAAGYVTMLLGLSLSGVRLPLLSFGSLGRVVLLSLRDAQEHERFGRWFFLLVLPLLLLLCGLSLEALPTVAVAVYFAAVAVVTAVHEDDRCRLAARLVTVGGFLACSGPHCAGRPLTMGALALLLIALAIPLQLLAAAYPRHDAQTAARIIRVCLRQTLCLSLISLLLVATVAVLAGDWLPTQTEIAWDDRSDLYSDLQPGTQANPGLLLAYATGLTIVCFVVVGVYAAARRPRPRAAGLEVLFDELPLTDLGRRLYQLTTQAKGRRREIIATYVRWRNQLQQHGIPAAPAAAPGEFADRLAAARPELTAQLGQLTVLFQAARYGAAEPDAGAARAARQAADGILAAVIKPPVAG